MVLVTEIAPLHIPNVITPNNDGINDCFRITGMEAFIGSRLEVRNKRGKIVYTKKNYTNDWDGAGQPDDIYFYYLELKQKNGETATYKGYLHIKRK